jgi:ABC-2 type transport system permease protein
VSRALGAPAGQFVRQVRYQLRMFLRSPVAVFFTVMLPLIMLLLFNSLFGDAEVDTPAGPWPLRQFYVGGLAAFTAVSATFTNLANVVPIRREEGILKRWRSTPLPLALHIAGMIGAAVLVAAVGVLIMTAVGVAFYGVEIDAGKLPVGVAMFVLGVGTFAALGIAVASMVRSAESAPAVANALILPLAFVSDVFVQMSDPPGWLTAIADVFPLRPFAQTFQDVFNPLVEPPAFVWDRFARVAAWGVFGVVLSLRYFRWEPARGTTGRTRRRRPRAT